MLASRASLPPSVLNPRQLVRLGMSLAIPRHLFMVSGPATSRRVALTFDDGPHPAHTPRLLDRLKSRNIPATFFVLGRAAEQHPELVRRMFAEGHDVGHHSFTHGEPPRTSARTLTAEARQTARLLGGLLGIAPPRLFRPPHGKLTAPKALALWAAGQSIVLWNRDPKDFACGDAETLRSWFTSNRLAGGDVVLLHDTHPHAAEVIDDIAGAVTSEGLAFGRVSDWVLA
jgi:peptidoglycan/xylan/chitin deacetylase (PgdA/CDA1 family)